MSLMLMRYIIRKEFVQSFSQVSRIRKIFTSQHIHLIQDVCCTEGIR